MADETPLDREGWSFQRCELCLTRTAQLTVDSQPRRRSGGEYHRFCWQCYWLSWNWRLGPIVNCGPAWDALDVRRETLKEVDSSSPS